MTYGIICKSSALKQTRIDSGAASNPSIHPRGQKSRHQIGIISSIFMSFMSSRETLDYVECCGPRISICIHRNHIGAAHSAAG